jgi:integrase
LPLTAAVPTLSSVGSVYQRTGRAHWYAKIRDPKTLTWRGVATPFLVDSAAGKRKALLWAAERDRLGQENIRVAGQELFARWVVPWLQQHFGYNQKTLDRYVTAWAHLYDFIYEHSLHHPREIGYKHAAEYLTWRTKQTRRRGTPINHNTALTEMKVMSRIMREAVRREYIDANPWAQLGIRRQRVRHTRAMTLEEIEVIRAALREREGALPLTKRWMTISFEIALHSSARLSETAIPFDRIHLDARTDPARKINLDRMTLFRKGKNGEPKIHPLPIHPVLRGLLLELRAAGARQTCELPRMAAKEWWKLRRDLNLQHLTFHSTRSTLATELHRNGVSLQKAKEILGHKSDAVHQVYLHLSAADVADELAGIDFSTRAAPAS